MHCTGYRAKTRRLDTLIGCCLVLPITLIITIPRASLEVGRRCQTTQPEYLKLDIAIHMVEEIRTANISSCVVLYR